MVPQFRCSAEIDRPQVLRSLVSGAQNLRTVHRFRWQPGGAGLALEHAIGMQLMVIVALLIALPTFSQEPSRDPLSWARVYAASLLTVLDISTLLPRPPWRQIL